MDPITHALTGYTISKILPLQSNDKVSVKTFTKALTISTMLGATSPDIDIVSSIFGGATSYFINHRGLTHSPIGLILLSLICAFLVKIFHKELSFKTLWIGAFLGCLSHILLDITNIYSTLALWPLSSDMYSLGFVPIIDPFVFFFFINGLLLTSLTLLKVHSRKIFITIMGLLIVYLSSRFYIQQNVEYFLISEYKGNNLSNFSSQNTFKKVKVMASSTLNTWSFIIENQNEFIKGKASFYPHHYEDLVTIKKKPLDIAIQKASQNPLGKFLLKFSPFIDYSVESYNGGYLVKMIDLRYSSPQSSKDKNNSGHFFGGHTILDKDLNTIFWGTNLSQQK